MLTFHELAPSPNNTKVRMALRFKGIEFEAVPVDPMNRASLFEVSGQELSPVIVDKGVVVNDSEAILQFLDANYEGPRLFPAGKTKRRLCDVWKDELDAKVARHWFPPFLFAIGMRDELDAEAVAGFAAGLAWLDAELGDRAHFKGEDMPICDLRVAEWATYALPGEGLIARCGLFKKFRDVYGVEAGSLPNLERFLVPWNERLA